MTLLLRYLPHMLALAAILFVGWSLYSWGHGNGAAKVQAQWDKERAELLEAYAQDMANARAKELTLVADMNAAAQQHEQEKQDAQAAADRVVSDLRAGNLRLHARWQAAAATRDLSSAATAAGQFDDAADDRNASAARIIGAAERCDAQVRGLQAVVRAYRGDQ